MVVYDNTKVFTKKKQDVGIPERQKVGKKGRDDSSVSNPLHIFFQDSQFMQKCLYFTFITFIYYQVATALLVAGSTLTFWIPPFASTSSYSSVVQSTRLLV